MEGLLGNVGGVLVVERPLEVGELLLALPGPVSDAREHEPLVLDFLVDRRAGVPHLRVGPRPQGRPQRAHHRLGQEHRLVEDEHVAGESALLIARERNSIWQPSVVLNPSCPCERIGRRFRTRLSSAGVFSTSDHTRSKCFCEVMNSCAEWMRSGFDLPISGSQVKTAVSSTTSRIPPFPFWRGTLTATSFDAHFVRTDPEGVLDDEPLPEVELEPDQLGHLEDVVRAGFPDVRGELDAGGGAGCDYHSRETEFRCGAVRLQQACSGPL